MRKAGYHALRFLWTALFALSLSGTWQPARAQDLLCDAALYDQMVQRGRLQGQRETVTFENLIYKPDSVMEFTCWSRFVNHIPPNIRYTSSYFEASGNDPDDPPTYEITNDFPPQPLGDLARVPGENWMFGNFGHTYLGGRLTSSPPTVAAAEDYVCDSMAAVWSLAQCQQFGPEDPPDGFYGLLAFASANDFRRFPVQCDAPYTVDIGQVPVTAAVVYTSALTVATDCGQPIPTGAVVNVPRDVNEPAGRPIVYNEKICANPTCNYVPTGLDAGTCNP